jgi:hypothetical protein
VQIEQMEDMQKLFVQTKNSFYEITVIDRCSGEILVRGGQLFPELTPARLSHTVTTAWCTGAWDHARNRFLKTALTFRPTSELF